MHASRMKIFLEKEEDDDDEEEEEQGTASRTRKDICASLEYKQERREDYSINIDDIFEQYSR